MLFHRACAAAATGSDVMYLCRRDRLGRPPLPLVPARAGHGAARAPSDAVLARVHIKYARMHA